MRETPMHRAEKSLLPMRRKMSPTAISNMEAHAIEQTGVDEEITSPASTTKDSLFYASSKRSVSSSKYEPGLPEKCLIPPFTPSRDSDKRENFTQNFHFRRPSEHFLEVLGSQKGMQAFPNTILGTSLPPLRKPNHAEDSLKRTPREVKIAFSGSVCNGGLSKPTNDDNQLLFLSGTKKAFVASNLPNKQILRKTNSLPLIKTFSNHTNGLCDLNAGPTFRNRTKSAVVSPGELVNESEQTQLPFDENLEEQNDAAIFDKPEEEQDPEKFSMICQWLKECEKSKIV